jgi:hypothetical protein
MTRSPVREPQRAQGLGLRQVEAEQVAALVG